MTGKSEIGCWVSLPVPQVSILSPDLWNVIYDILLRSEMLEETFLVRNADDVPALIAELNIEMAQLKLN